MSKIKNKHGWIKKFNSYKDEENIHLKFINDKRAEKHLTNLHALLKEIANSQLDMKVVKNIE